MEIISICDTWHVDGKMVGGDQSLFRYLVESFNLDRFIPLTLMGAAERFNIPYSTIAQAAREGRLPARRETGTWLTTGDAVQNAIADGRLRPRRRSD